AGNFVGVAVELAAGVQSGHDDLCGGNFFAVDVHVVDGNAAAVVDYGDGVIDDFIHQVMQAEFAGRADVHGGTFAHGFHAAENFDRVGGVVSVGGFAVLVLRVEEFGLQFFRGHSAPWRM